MWYVLQTMTGKEEELVCMIRKILRPDWYNDCFVAYYERIWRKQQQSLVHIERLFPGYVFIISKTPEQLFLQLKQVPAMSKLMADGEFTFLALEQEEENFFREMLETNHVVRLSYVKTNGKGRALQIAGPLKLYEEQVVRFQFKKRYAIIRLTLLGEEKTVSLGIFLDEDIRQEIAFGKIEAPLQVPEHYPVETFLEGEPLFAVGDHIKVISGAFENMSGVVWKVKKNVVEIGIRLFGQDMSVEMPVENIVPNFR